MRRSTGWVALLSAAAVNAAAIVPAVSAEAATNQSTTVRGAAPAPTGRLKFKHSGPVCKCGDGLSEQDLEQALAKTSKQRKTTRPDSASSRGQARSQHDNLNLGVPK